jgi:L-fuculose-phosphate aldolase
MTRDVRRELREAGRRVVAIGLTRGTSGNLSARTAGGFLVTASGASLGDLDEDDLVELGADGARLGDGLRPSSEWRIHRDIYLARPEVGAVVHAHPPFATSIACLRRDLPAVHYELAFAGGAEVRCAEYATFGTPELSAAALAALAGRKACLLANHGVVALGASIADALAVAEIVETVAELFWRASAVGAPVVLPDDEMARVLERFGSYGKGRPDPDAA